MTAIFKANTAKPLYLQEFYSDFLHGMEKLVEEVEKDFDNALDYWSKSPEMESIVQVDSQYGKIELRFFCTNEIFIYWEEGTKPHIIRPLARDALAWETGGFDIMRTVSIREVGWELPTGAEMAFAKEVHHPGTEGHHLWKELSEKYDDRWQEIVLESLEDAVALSGHSVKE